MVRRGWLLAIGFASLCAPSPWALDDLLLYSDVGCQKDKAFIEQSFAQVSGGVMEIATNQKIPTTCSQFHRGTDAFEMNLTSDLSVGGYYDFLVKFPDWGQKDVKAYKDVRFFVKNLLAHSAKVSARWENGSYQSSPLFPLVIPADTGWQEVVIPLTAFGDFCLSGLMNGFGFSQPTPVTGSQMHLLIDDMRVTDGTGQGTLELPALPGGRPPEGWAPHLMVGSYDNHQDSSTSLLLKGKVNYRYQYLTTGWKTYSNGKWIEEFVARSNQLGLRSAFTWYQVAKAGESGPTVKSNLMAPAFMKTYFDDFELALTQIAASGADHPILVLEPDMYGFLLQGGLVPNHDASQVSVDMAEANALSGKTWSGTLKGFCEYMVSRAKEKVPHIIVGHLINSWGILIPGEIGQGSMDAHLSAAAITAKFINSLGSVGKGDLVFVEKADRDAGTKGSKWFWNEEQYSRYFAWTKMISSRTDLRICGWQISQGMSSSPSNNQDDAAESLRDHPDRWANAGFIGVLFGAGMEGQADYSQTAYGFLDAMAAYQSHPISLPQGSTTAIFPLNQRKPPRQVSNFLFQKPGLPVLNVRDGKIDLLGRQFFLLR